MLADPRHLRNIKLDSSRLKSVRTVNTVKIWDKNEAYFVTYRTKCLSQGLRMKTKDDVILLNAECNVTRRVQFFTDYRLSVHFCVDCIANTWEENSHHGNLYSV